MTALSDHAWYVYAVVPEGAAAPRCTQAILAGADLVVLTARAVATPGGGATNLAALASLVPRALFGTDTATSRAGDPDWVAARAAAHHEVVASLAAHCACLPLGFGTLFASAASLRQWLTEHAVRLRHAMAAVAERVEWSLILAEDKAAHGAWVACQDAALLALRHTVESAGPGTAFLLQRQLGRARDAARAAHCRQAAADIAARLAALGDYLRAEPARHDATWNLLAARGYNIAEAMRPTAEALTNTGLELRVTGPWPPYAYARTAWQDHANG